MVSRISPPAGRPFRTAPKPRGHEPDAEDRANFLKACENGHDYFITSYLKDWPGHSECYWTATGHTGLLCAALHGRESTAKLLLEKGAKLHALDNEGANALMLAAQSGNENLVSFLLTRGFNVNAKDKEGRTALHHFVFGGNDDRNSNVPAILIKAGADINATSPAGVKPLQWALSLGRKLVFRTLLDLGADFSDPMLAAFAEQMESDDFTTMLKEEPARREKEVDDVVSGGIAGSMKIKKPFTVSTQKVEKKQPTPQVAPLNTLRPLTATRSWTA